MGRRASYIILAALLIAISILALGKKPVLAEDYSAIWLPGGYRIEEAVTGLTYPTAVAWDEAGVMYISEGGHALGSEEAGPGRIVRVADGAKSVIADGLASPVSDVKFKDGAMYVAHKGTLSVYRDGVRHDTITDVPAGDHSLGEIAFDEEGFVYVGSGSATNSGVVGEDNFNLGWPQQNPMMYDSPPYDAVLSGQNFRSGDPRTPDPSDTTITGPFSPFGTPALARAVAKGQKRATSAVLRVREDGSDLTAYAWGLRNPYGIGFDPEGNLLVIDQAYEDRGSRPVANAPDPMFLIEEGSWCGWPDYVAGAPITDPVFRSGSSDLPLRFLLLEHPPITLPIYKLDPEKGAIRFDFAPAGFTSEPKMFIAAFGPGKGDQGEGRVLALSLETGRLEDFAYNRPDRPFSPSLGHPIDVKFGPDGSMYIVDFGQWKNGEIATGTGVVWRVYRQRSEYATFVNASLEMVANATPWNPDYQALTQKVQDWVNRQPTQWGVFFKDLASGKTFGVNDRIDIPAASTVKVAVVLYASHLAEQGQLSLGERMTYDSQRDWRSGAGVMQYTAKDGDTFTLRELAEKAIRDSDNVAWKMLERRLGKDNIIQFMWSLGGENVYPGGQNITTPKDNATYMEAALAFAKDNTDGGKLLFDLAHTVWNTGLNRNIDEVVVAHKEGDVTGVADDVGIIFADHPYILSIMSNGHGDVEEGFRLIGELSRMIFDYQMSLEAY